MQTQWNGHGCLVSRFLILLHVTVGHRERNEPILMSILLFTRGSSFLFLSKHGAHATTPTRYVSERESQSSSIPSEAPTSSTCSKEWYLDVGK